MNPETVIVKSADLINTVASGAIFKGAALMNTAATEAAAAASPGAMPAMSSEMMAAGFGAIIGALAAGIILIAFESIKQYRANNALIKTLKMGLYFEITDNHIIELNPEEDGALNFSLPIFHDSFYQQNKTDIARLFNEELLTKLSTFYSLTSRADIHYKTTIQRFIQLEANSQDASQDEFINLYNQKQDLKRLTSDSLFPAFGLRQCLSSELKNAFEIDPDKVNMHIPKKYKKMFRKRFKEIEQELEK